MSRAFVKDDDQEDTPLVIPRAFLPKGATNYVTREGMTALLEERRALISQRDNLPDNESDSRVMRNYLNATIRLLDERIDTAVVVDIDEQSPKVVSFGTYVTIATTAKREREREEAKKKAEGSNNSIPTSNGVNSPQEQIIRITGADEANSSNAISFFSPLAMALSGHKTGDTVSISLPSGEFMVTIKEIFLSAPIQYNQKREKDLHVSGSVSDTTSSSPAPEKRATTTDERTDDVAQNSPTDDKSDKTSPLDKSVSYRGVVTEILPLVNDRGITIGRATKGQCHDGNKLLHPAIRAYIFNSNGDLLLQRQPSASKWDTSAYCHMRFGEKPEQALKREIEGRLGIQHISQTLVKCYRYESGNERELIHIFKIIYDGSLDYDNKLYELKFWSITDIREALREKKLAKIFEQEFKALFNKIL